MKLLELLESHYHIFLCLKFLGFSHKSFLISKILLEIIITKFFIDLKLIIELLHSILIVFPYLTGILLGHLPYLLKLRL